MAIKDLYSEVEKEKTNKVKESSSLSMSKEEFISEHKNLIKVLRSGDKKAQEAEAVKQEKELTDKCGDGMDEEADKDDEDDGKGTDEE
jgi:hypothetical protein